MMLPRCCIHDNTTQVSAFPVAVAPMAHAAPVHPNVNEQRRAAGGKVHAMGPQVRRYVDMGFERFKVEDVIRQHGSDDAAILNALLSG